jgi:hypothetical protein
MLRAGGEIDAYCTRCELTLAHTVIAVDGGRPAKVECNTCHGVHRYREPAGAPRTSAPRARAARARPVEISFDALIASRTRPPVPYSPRRVLAVDDVVDHPTFGRGFVSAVRGDKVEITFRGEVRTLVHARP